MVLMSLHLPGAPFLVARLFGGSVFALAFTPSLQSSGDPLPAPILDLFPNCVTFMSHPDSPVTHCYLSLGNVRGFLEWTPSKS